MTGLRQRFIEDMTVRNLAPTTQATYVQPISMFARHFGKSPEVLGPEQIRSYQTYLATEKQLAPSAIGPAVAALRFLYNVTLQKHWAFFGVLGTTRGQGPLQEGSCSVSNTELIEAAHRERSRPVPPCRKLAELESHNSTAQYLRALKRPPSTAAELHQEILCAVIQEE